jgi:hypothetical protein
LAQESDRRVNLPVAVPLHVRQTFDKEIPKRKRSATVTKMICDEFGIPVPQETVKALQRPTKKEKRK